MFTLYKFEELAIQSENHTVKLDRAVNVMAINVSCSCGYKDVWNPEETTIAVANRFNRHTLKNKLRGYIGTSVEGQK